MMYWVGNLYSSLMTVVLAFSKLKMGGVSSWNRIARALKSGGNRAPGPVRTVPMVGFLARVMLAMRLWSVKVSWGSWPFCFRKVWKCNCIFSGPSLNM